MEIQVAREPFAVLIRGVSVAGGVENSGGVLNPAHAVVSIEKLAVRHEALIAVLAEVVEKERTFRSDQPLDRLDEEFVRERRLEAAGETGGACRS